jgi:hypothetical protein
MRAYRGRPGRPGCRRARRRGPRRRTRCPGAASWANPGTRPPPAFPGARGRGPCAIRWPERHARGPRAQVADVGQPGQHAPVARGPVEREQLAGVGASQHPMRAETDDGVDRGGPGQRRVVALRPRPWIEGDQVGRVAHHRLPQTDPDGGTREDQALGPEADRSRQILESEARPLRARGRGQKGGGQGESGQTRAQLHAAAIALRGGGRAACAGVCRGLRTRE